MSSKKRSGTAREKQGVNGGVKTFSGLTTHLDRARARELRDTRIDYIIGKMSRGSWDGARSHRELSKRWGVSPGCIADYAAEASRTIRRAVSGDLETIKTQILTGIDQVRRTAMTLQKYVRTDEKTWEEKTAPDVGAALRAYELQAKMLGMLVDKHQTVSGFEGMSKEEHLAELDRLRGEIDEEERKLRGEVLQ